MTDPIRSADLLPGTVLIHRWSGDRAVLECRKEPGDGRSNPDLPFMPGWWIKDSGGGLGDFVIDSEQSAWNVVSTPNVTALPAKAPTAGDVEAWEIPPWSPLLVIPALWAQDHEAPEDRGPFFVVHCGDPDTARHVCELLNEERDRVARLDALGWRQ